MCVPKLIQEKLRECNKKAKKLTDASVKRNTTYTEKKIKQGNNEAQKLYMLPKKGDYGVEAINYIVSIAIEVIKKHVNIHFDYLIKSVKVWYSNKIKSNVDLKNYSYDTIKVIVEENVFCIEEDSNSFLKRVTKTEAILTNNQVSYRHKAFVNRSIVNEAYEQDEEKKKSKKKRTKK